jgi:hypothetical protein
MKTINNNVEESRVSFENAVLLKKAGFVPNKPMIAYRLDKEVPELYRGKIKSVMSTTDPSSIDYLKNEKDVIFVPTHSLVVEWIRVNFDIDIQVSPRSWSTDVIKWSVWLNDLKNHNFSLSCDVNREDNPYDTKQDAYEVGITYVLEKWFNLKKEQDEK